MKSLFFFTLGGLVGLVAGNHLGITATEAQYIDTSKLKADMAERAAHE